LVGVCWSATTAPSIGVGDAAAVDSFVLNIGTPLPAALPLFATGIGALGLIGWRRKRKAQARG